MKTHKLSWEDTDEEDWLVALQTSLRAHQVAFLLNQTLNSRFVRKKDDFHDTETDVYYPLFYWKKTDEETWYVIANKCKEETLGFVGLFSSVEKTHCLIKELKKMDYLLLVCNPSSDFQSKNILEKLKKSSLWDFLHKVEIISLKSKHKLIFQKYV